MARRPYDDDDASDDAPWLAEGVREERSTLVPRARLFGGGLLVLALVVLVALGVYLASGHKSDGSSGYARPEDAPLIAAEPGAYKVAPADPGGARITGIDDSVAAVAAGRDQGSAILPDEPEEPLARPTAGGAPPPPTDLLPRSAAPAAPPSVAVAPPALPPRPVAPAPVVAPAVKASLPPAPAPRPDKPAKVDAAAAVAQPKSRPGDAVAADGDPLAPARPARPVAPVADAPKSTGGSVALQLGAFSTRDKADAAWAKAGGDGALAGLSKRVEPVDRDGTTLYRLRAAGVASRDAAKALCGRIRSAGNVCIVAE